MEENNKSESVGRGSTKMCSVLFVDIVGYSKKTNAEQIVMKQQFVKLWAKAMKDVPPDDVMVVDAGDGAALTALVEPEDTIRVAMALREATEEHNMLNQPLDIRMGINFGPVQLSVDVHGKACIVGDAINIAQRIMSFADAGQITISRSYYDVIKPLAHKYEEMFYYLGQRSDKHVRYHHIYGLGKRGESPPIGNAISDGIAPIKHDDHSEETRADIPVAQTNATPSAPTIPQPAHVSFPARVMNSIGSAIKAVWDFFASLIRSIWNFFASIYRSIRNFIWGWFRWLRFVVPLLIIVYEVLVLMPLIDKPEDVKKELGSQAAAVTGFVKSGFGLLKQEAKVAMVKRDEDKSGETGTQPADTAQPSKVDAGPATSKGK